MRWLFVGLALLVSPIASWGNDFGIEGVGGTLRPIKGEHRSVRMVREWVRIDVHRASYETTVDFEFQNAGPATTVAMGFPERGSGVMSKAPRRSGFTRFSTWVDGRRITARRVLLHTGWENEGKSRIPTSYEACWVKRVRFEHNQRRKVRVRYCSRLGNGLLISYNFTGGNWRGDIQSSKLKIVLHAPFTVGNEPSFSKRGEEPESLSMRQRGRNLSYSWRNWQAEGLFDCWFTTPKARRRKVKP